jgi:PAS domain S-box-containing protein
MGWSAVTDLRYRVLFDLAKRDKSDLPATLAEITEGSALVLGVGRMSVWRLTDDNTAIECQDLYLADERRHQTCARLLARECPEYFKALMEERTIVANDAREDPRTHEFRDGYLQPNRITSMLDVPIWHRGRLYGVLCHEHTGPRRTWQPEEIAFAINMADIVSVSLEASERRESESRWKAVVETMAEGVLVMDQEGTFQFMNPVMEKLAGRVGSWTMDDRMRTLEYVDAADRPLPADRWPGQRALRGETVKGEIVGVHCRASSELRYMRVTAAPLRREGEIEGFVGVVNDVSEEVQFERIKRDFLAALAHELKTPIAIVKGYAQLLARTATLSSVERASLDTIGRATDRMDLLVQQLVDVSNVILGRLALTREPVDLTALVRTVVERLARAERRHVTVVVRGHEGLPVLADVPRIEQAVRQLLDNAIRFSPEGNEVRVELTREGDRALVRIVDKGIGIPSDRQQQLFRLFYRAHANTPDDTGGLGLGLFLSREIITRHGGTVQCQSLEGQGSVFSVRLPLAEAA